MHMCVYPPPLLPTHLYLKNVGEKYYKEEYQNIRGTKAAVENPFKAAHFRSCRNRIK